MTRKKSILVLTQRFDPHADIVIAELNERGMPVLRWDTADFPTASSLSANYSSDAWDGTLEVGNRTIGLEDVVSIWYRRPRPFRMPAELSEIERQFGRREAQMGVGGILRCLPGLWVNHPERIVTAEYKPYQLWLAHTLGLDIPRTLITNVAAEACAFFDTSAGGIVYKPLSPSLIRDGDERSVIYTTVVDRKDLEASQLNSTATMLQEIVPRDYELRITVFGDDLYTAAIRAPVGTLDWRKHYEQLQYSVAELPRSVATAVRRLMRRLGLVFGAIDMIVTPDGRYVFIEVNPSGQWIWIQNATGLPLVDAMVRLLSTGRDRVRRSDRTGEIRTRRALRRPA